MKYKTARAWYASPEHFRSERSWEEYSARAKNRKSTKRRPRVLTRFPRPPRF
jgi:hypothetical protein